MPSQVVMVDGLVSGLESCAPFALVWNRFQPPCAGGSFFCRRVATLPPVGELQIDLEADLLQEIDSDQTEPLISRNVGAADQYDRRAIVAGLTDELPSAIEVRFAVWFGSDLGAVWAAAYPISIAFVP